MAGDPSETSWRRDYPALNGSSCRPAERTPLAAIAVAVRVHMKAKPSPDAGGQPKPPGDPTPGDERPPEPPKPWQHPYA